MQTVTWSNATIPEWQEYTSGVPGVRKIPEGYVIIEMYNTSRNENYQPVRGGVEINGENYWPVKLKHRSTGHTKWVGTAMSLPSNPLSKKPRKTQQDQTDEHKRKFQRLLKVEKTFDDSNYQNEIKH